MTIWEFHACVDGWSKSQGAEERADAPTAEEHLALVQRVRERRVVH